LSALFAAANHSLGGAESEPPQSLRLFLASVENHPATIGEREGGFPAAIKNPDSIHQDSNPANVFTQPAPFWDICGTAHWRPPSPLCRPSGSAAWTGGKREKAVFGW